jgi:hypothetical protein
MAEHRSTPEFSFTLAHRQNRFFRELAEALVYELHQLGAAATIAVGEVPVPRDGLVHVLLPPHEYVALSGHRPSPDVLRRSIVISAEQPDSSFFEWNVSIARDAGAVFDINPRAVRAYQGAGVPSSLLELGHTALWDRYSGAPDDGRRDIDILFLGSITSRRAAALAGYSNVLERFRCHIALSDNSRPNFTDGASFVVGEVKRDLLARSKVMINLHAEDEPYFEWLRVVEAICAGCVVVSEHSTDIAPIEWGRHVVTGRVGTLGLLAAWLVDAEARRLELQRDAHEFLRQRRPLSNAARALIEAGREIAGEPPELMVTLPARLDRLRVRTTPGDYFSELQPLTRTDISTGEALTLRALKSQQSSLLAVRRQLARLQRDLTVSQSREPGTFVVAESRAWSSRARASLTAVIPLYNHRGDVVDALDSLTRSTRSDWEVVIVDDGSTDEGGEIVEAWMESRPEVAALLLRHELNRGLAAARNTGVQHARADRLLMLDADNELRRNAVSRLMDALDAEPGASFAYGIMERFSSDGPQGLLNYFGWDPQRLRISNYIDAFALVRHDALDAMQGYTYDPRLFGWEDYDLWVRMAEAGRFGVFVPEIIARYRVGHSSMISETNVSTADAYAALVEHAPKLMSGLRIPA